MQTSVTFKNLDPSENLKTYVSDKLDKFDRLLDNPAEANVVLLVEKFRHIAEIKITGDRLTINGKEETNDMYSAIDMVLDKIEKQLKKTKQKIRDHRSSSTTRVADMVTSSSPPLPDEIKYEGEGRQVVVNHIEYKPMDVEEAVMQMDLSDDNFLVFTNARTDRINVLYHRNDGHYGLIQPND
ncbi:ribosome-associated translation inhibitor RaiA [Desulfobacterales bacterium HSG16]|nr:ribosome-associated translation inhibitor RaiA [Desulfobacterales bacterium HSG16]